MADRPILFQGDMVRALLAGTKTQTRRAIKPQPFAFPLPSGRMGWNWNTPKATLARWIDEPRFAKELAQFSPFGQPGDRLWVREAWRADKSLDDLSATRIAEKCLDAGYPKPWAPIQYEADGVRANWVTLFHPPHDTAPGRYRHARFMPRWASRITLEITGVRVERLQAISEEDAGAEGVVGWDYKRGVTRWDQPRSTNRDEYRLLWEQINGPGSWDANPYVWVIEFRRSHA